jgi:putative flavoprotein involved in K+ transport
VNLPDPSEGERVKHIRVVVIGAGHAGLAMSRRLSERSIEHVVLERAEVANSWSTERWDSLRLLTPNWQSQLPAMSYEGDDPDGFMTMPEVVDFISAYADTIAAPVQTQTTVTRVCAAQVGYVVETDKGSWTCEALVIASGGSNVANVPALASEVPGTIATETPMTYRSPEYLDHQGVLIVGASATGVQLADEIHRSGRDVTISVGEHVRLPRTYRGRDVFWWMDAAGISDQRHTEMDDLVRARNLPSPQLIGTPERRSIDLNSLTDRGVKIVGRLGRITGGQAQFAGSLANVCSMADLKMNRLLQAFDDWANASRLEISDPPQRFDPTRIPSTPRLSLDLVDGGIGTIVWATGYRPDYSWLHVPVVDRKGRIRHDGGIVEDAPGIYVIGLNMLRRRRSSFINGAQDDSEEISNHLEKHLAELNEDPQGQTGKMKWKPMSTSRSLRRKGRSSLLRLNVAASTFAYRLAPSGICASWSSTWV